ncbi:DegT/DnrJ/EryC1/StrS family aminotransferase [Bauldia litoralis]|uniref:dTDP-4-amino-4,6-dideoxygalactose transaminase n=1 Tax=Bauldia litoralis TaxID=665467 RepID=A0A1G6CV97_9HYPH|nr:DegT/DnrJ/EryC1/StrS aminotransferase family protein [Bauldia litoralis]SDB36847.1 dTDP-4-amino-4,6-dideoxygalactose transaminase [Bauldia litoralis]
MSGSPFSPWPAFTEEEADATRAVMLSNQVNYWTGPQGRSFEQEFAAFTGTACAIAVANGTVALDLAWMALGVGPGDEVIVTPRTFIASVSSIVNTGAVPVFADVDRDSQNITPETVTPLISPKTRAILTVHLNGWPCEMDGFRDIANATGVSLVEDCAQAHGARFRGSPVGALGDIAAWSFCQDKIMSTGGEGGMLTTNRRDLWSSAWSYKDHGKSPEAAFERQRPAGYRWLHDSFGSNARLTEMQSAIGRIQLKRMPAWHGARTRNAAAILEAAHNHPVWRVPDMPPHIDHAWYRCHLAVRPDSLKNGWDRDRIIARINALGVPCNVGSCPEVYRERAFDDTGYRPAQRLAVARELGETSVVFLVHPTLTVEEIDRTCLAISDVAREAIR